MDERIGSGLHHSRENRGSVGRVSAFWLRVVQVVSGGLDQGLDG